MSKVNGALMYKLGSAQQTSTLKVPIFFLKFKKRGWRLSVKETNADTENASNWDDFGFAVNYKKNWDERALFGEFSSESWLVS